MKQHYDCVGKVACNSTVTTKGVGGVWGKGVRGRSPLDMRLLSTICHRPVSLVHLQHSHYCYSQIYNHICSYYTRYANNSTKYLQQYSSIHISPPALPLADVACLPPPIHPQLAAAAAAAPHQLLLHLCRHLFVRFYC